MRISIQTLLKNLYLIKSPHPSLPLCFHPPLSLLDHPSRSGYHHRPQSFCPRYYDVNSYAGFYSLVQVEKLARRKEMTKINIWILRSHHNIQIETDILVEKKSRNEKNPRCCALTWPGFLFLGDPVESYVCRQS